MLSADYYDILGITRSCEEFEIKEAYRRAALRYHPKKSTEEGSSAIFNDIAEAYQILIDQRTRAIYDQYGRRGLGKAEWLDQNYNGDLPNQEPKYENVELKDSMAVFEEFFATANPYAASLTRNEKEDLTCKKMPQPPVQNYYYCTLEEIYEGCQKTVTLFRKTKEGKNEARKLCIEVEKGCKAGVTVKFKAAGNETEKLLPADVFYTMKECPHPRFERNNNDLIYTHDIPLKKALCGETVQLLTLDGRKLSIPINYVVSTNSEHVVKNEGLPTGEEGKFGNLVIKFNIIFPKEVSERTKNQLSSIEI